MKWYVYWHESQKYQLMDEKTFSLNPISWIAMFQNFDMAYDYVTKANKMTDVMAYSRWAR